MDDKDWLTAQFEENRGRLRGIAYKMLGSASEADDAVQEAWLRLNRSESSGIQNLGGWLTTVVARVCLDALRSRKARREFVAEQLPHEPYALGRVVAGPEQEALLAESVGVALLVILERLSPAERLAFVLHDMLDVSFEEIGTILGRTPAATRQLASRARRRVRGTQSASERLGQQRALIDAFLGALRARDFERLLEVLDPDVVVRIDQAGGLSEIRGARNWAKDAVAYSQVARFAQPALVDGEIGAVFAPRGRLFSVLRFTVHERRIARVEVIVNAARFRDLELLVL